MKIGFAVFYKNSYSNESTGVWGDEIVARSLCAQLKSEGLDADVYTKDELKENPVDVLVHTTFQIIHPLTLKRYAQRNILWIQGLMYENGKIVPLNEIYNSTKSHYDLVITSSRKLAKDFNIPFVLPFTGLEDYREVETNESYDVSFIGNIIKPFETNVKYLQPLYAFKYGLFGGDFGKVTHRKALEIISGSKVNLHYGFDECVDWDLVTGTPFFHSLCGAFTMMDKVPYFMETFGNSMAFTAGGDEETEQLKYYLNNEDVRKTMARESFEIVKSIKNDNLLKLIQGV